MKYARIDIETIGFASKKDKAHINLGDHLQNIIIKDLYKMMGIKEEEIYVLNFNEISTYSGDYLILPINQAISHSLNTFISPKIIPVFLGISRDTSAITQDEELYMKKYAPIGCRDQAIFDFLSQRYIDCYLNGCITLLLDRRPVTPPNSVPYIIEAPQYAIDNMPLTLKEHAVYLENTFYGTYEEITQGKTLEEVVRERYNLLKNNASVVITSRMHIASPCVGMGIPVILVRKSIDYRFSWIDKYIPVYTEKDKQTIDWYPKVIDIEQIKLKIMSNAKDRIERTFAKYASMLEISEFYENRKKVEYDLPQFSKSVIDFVSSRWGKDDEWKYAFWGENDASERLYTYLNENYPHAKYVAFYDSYKKINYHGKLAEHPSNINPNDDIFIFVTGYTATDSARELFRSMGKDESMYYLFGSVVRGY